MDLYFLRHTTLSVDNGMCFGQSEITVSSSFLQEASDTMKLVPDKHNAVYFASPTRRCIQLAEFISKRPAMQDLRLADLHFGDWEKQYWADIQPDQLDDWMQDIVINKVPGGESYGDVLLRVQSFIEDISKKNHKTVVISTHASVIRAVLSYVLEIPFHRTFDIHIAFGSITKISVDKDSFIVEYINRV